MKINKNYLSYFKYFGNKFNYMITNGVWLTFNKESLVYEGIFSMYPITSKQYVRYENKGLEYLIRSDMIDLC